MSDITEDIDAFDEIGRIRSDHSLPQQFYTSQAAFRTDIEEVFYKEWLFVASVAELRNPGDFITLQVHEAPIIVLRDQDGELRAFFNSCRHRGSRICTEARGNAARLVCPYHQWTYELSGELVAARFMGADFRHEDFPLKPVHLTLVEGLIYICLAETSPDVEAFRAAIAPYIRPHDPSRTKLVYESTIVENANWKLVIENNRECYHCAGAHPELLVSLIEMALPDDQRFGDEFEIMREKAAEWDALGIPHAPVDGGVEFRCIRLPFRRGALSMTMDGQPACKKLLGDLTEPDLGSVRAFRIPNNWHHFLSDMIIHFRILPIGPEQTEMRTSWFVHEDAIEGWDYDPERVAEVWLATNDQDRRLAEENQRGVRSPSYEPGPYSEVAEFMVIDFIEWYRRTLRRAAGGPTDQAAE